MKKNCNVATKRYGGLLNTRMGTVTVLFESGHSKAYENVHITHRDPVTGNYWVEGDDTGLEPLNLGMWVKAEQIVFTD